jgi:hypothetical protein
MRTLKKASCLAALLFVSTPALRADVASGEYTVPFNNALNLWDISGTYRENTDLFDMDYTLNMQPSGKFTGLGTSSYYESGLSLNGDFTVNGGITSAGTLVRVSFVLSMTGTGNYEGNEVIFSAKASEVLEIDTAGQQMVGTTSGGVKVTIPELKRSRSAKIPKSEVVTALPPGMDGSWELTVNLNTNATKYAGTANVELVNGRDLPLVATGSYTPKTDLSKITLKGTDVNKGLALTLNASASAAQMDIKKLTGKLLGQKVNFTEGQ